MARTRRPKNDGSALLSGSDHLISLIHVIRGERVMIDADLAALYGVRTKALVQAVKRNVARFPDDFLFRLTSEEFAGLRSQIVTSKNRRGGRRQPPLAFTEHGVAMLSSVLRSPRAILVNVEIVRTFVRLRSMLASQLALARKLDALESRYDESFRVVFDAIRRLKGSPSPTRRRIGFRPHR